MSAGAFIKIARYMQETNLTHRRGFPGLDMDTRVTILDGLISSNTARYTLIPDCSSGNCTLPSYNDITHSSIGMCRKCANVTPWLVERKDVEGMINIVLPDGSSVGNSTKYPIHVQSITGRNWEEKYLVANGPWNGSFLAAFGDEFRDVFRSSIFNVSLITETNKGYEHTAHDDPSPPKCLNNGVPT
jgi:hypothetical protein